MKLYDDRNWVRRAASVLLTASMTLSLIPTPAFRAMAEELPSEVPAAEEPAAPVEPEPDSALAGEEVPTDEPSQLSDAGVDVLPPEAPADDAPGQDDEPAGEDQDPEPDTPAEPQPSDPTGPADEVDVTAPVVKVRVEAASEFVQSARVVVEVEDDDFDASSSTVTFDGQARTGWSGGTLSIDLADGTYDAATLSDKLAVRVVDTSGNVAEAPSVVMPEGLGKVTVDTTAPTIDVAWTDAEGNEVEVGDGSYHAGDLMATISVTDANADPSKLVVTIDGDEAGSADANGVIRLSVSGEGEHTVTATATDLAGNEAEAYSSAFTIDSSAPVVTVELPDGVLYDGDGFELTVRVEDDSVDADWLASNASLGLTLLPVVNHELSDEPTAVPVTDLDWSEEDGAMVAHAMIDSGVGEGVYTAIVANVADKAGNPSESEPTSMSVEVDATEPTVTVSLNVDPAGAIGDTPVYGQPVNATITVTDRNVSEGDLEMGLPTGAQSQGWTKSGTNPDTWVANVNYPRQGSYDELTAEATDRVGNASGNKSLGTLVIDDAVPVVTGVRVSTSPATVLPRNTGDIQFHNASTQLTVTFSDGVAIKSARLDGYDGTLYWHEGDAEGTAVIVLEEGVDLTRSAFLTLVDYAGNTRVWSLSPQGTATLVAKGGAGVANEPVAGVAGNVAHPGRLVLDTTAPTISLDGPAAGSYSNTDQAITATVSERNLAYLRSDRSSQVVVTISGRGGRTITLPVSLLSETGTLSHLITEDGHYTVIAQLTDIAGNASATASLGEFTIDKTAPVIGVSFDNNSVRNGKYYNAPRTATITVIEHNFDPALIDIKTTGTIGGWSHSGDTHTCTVFFGEGGNHTLSVSGSDLAGNVADPYSCDPFVVDLTAPVVSITNLGEPMDGMAYAGEVAPLITYSDEANFDQSGTSHSISRANAAPDRTTPAGSVSAVTGNTQTVSWTDFPHDIAHDDLYTITASMTDLAGNTATAEATFSVNRFGSVFVVEEVSTPDNEWESADQEAREAGTVLLTSSPTVRITEVNVSGASPLVDPAVAHFADVEHANTTEGLALTDSDEGVGYSVDESRSTESGTSGWARYEYTIPAANFGEGSQSDAGDGGQGDYLVTVGSYDVTEPVVTNDDGTVASAGRANLSSIFYANDSGSADVSDATVGFVLDEVGPEIVEADVPDGLSVGGSATVTVTVLDRVGSDANIARATVSGSEVEVRSLGDGRYEFDVPATPFGSLASSEIEFSVTDFAGRSDSFDARANVSTMVGETATGAAIVAGIGAALAAARRRMKHAND